MKDIATIYRQYTQPTRRELKLRERFQARQRTMRRLRADGLGLTMHKGKR